MHVDGLKAFPLGDLGEIPASWIEFSQQSANSDFFFPPDLQTSFIILLCGYFIPLGIYSGATQVKDLAQGYKSDASLELGPFFYLLL